MVYQLEIDGVETTTEVEPAPTASAAPAPPEPPSPPQVRSFDRRMEEWAETLSFRIEEQVASSLERSLDWIPVPVPRLGAPTEKHALCGVFVMTYTAVRG